MKVKPQQICSSSPSATGCLGRVQADKNDVYLLPKHSMRKCRHCAFLPYFLSCWTFSMSQEDFDECKTHKRIAQSSLELLKTAWPTFVQFPRISGTSLGRNVLSWQNHQLHFLPVHRLLCVRGYGA